MFQRRIFLRSLIATLFIITISLQFRTFSSSVKPAAANRAGEIAAQLAGLKNHQPIRSRKAPVVKSATINFTELAIEEMARPKISPKEYLQLAPLEDIEQPDFPMPEQANIKDGGEPVINNIGSSIDIEPEVSSPAPIASFQALIDNGKSIPPDTNGAVGPNHLMVTTNSEIRIQDRNGNELRRLSLDSFWASFGGDTFDPKILYDPIANRWIFIVTVDPNSTNSSTYIAVTASSDPTQTWVMYSIKADDDEVLWADYPSLGFNDSSVVIAENLFTIGSSSKFDRTRLTVINKSKLYGPNGSLTSVSLFDDNTTGTQHPAVTYDAGVTTMYLVSTINGNFNGKGFLRLDKITGPADDPTLTTEVAFPSSATPWASRGPRDNFGPQSGSSNQIDMGDNRMLKTILRNGKLWCAHTIFLPATSPNRAAVQYWQFDTSGNVLKLGTIQDSNANTFVAYPSLAVNRNDDMLIGYSFFSPTIFASSGYNFRAGSDPGSDLRDGAILKGGENGYFKTFSGSKNRWGDYSNTVIDPTNDLDFWTIQQYAASPANTWGTWWGRIAPPNTTPADFSFNITPASQTVSPGGTGNYSINFSTSGGFSSPVSFSFSNLPLNSSVPQFSGNFPLPFRVVTSANTPPGNYTVTVTGSGGGITHSATFTLVVQNGQTPMVSLRALQNSATIDAGAAASYAIALDRNNFGGSVQLGLNILLNSAPPGISFNYSSNPTTSSNVTLTINTTSDTPAGSYQFVATGSASGATVNQSPPFTLTVNTPVRQPIINSANYSKPIITITGSNFGNNDPSLFINGRDVSFTIIEQTDTLIRAKGNKRKLGLQSGANQVQVISNGVASSIFTFSTLQGTGQSE